MNVSNFVELCSNFTSQTLMGIAFASTVLCSVAILFNAAARKQSAAVRFWIWQAAVSGVLVATLVLISTKGIPLSSPASVDRAYSPDSTTFAPQVPSTATAMDVWTPDEARTAKLDRNLSVSSGSSSKVHAQGPDALTHFIEAGESRSEGTGIATTGQEAGLARHSVSNLSLSALIFLIWLLFVVVYCVRFVACIIVCYGITRRATPTDDDKVAAAYRGALKRVTGTKTEPEMSRSPDLLVSGEVHIPFTIGVLRPKIVLPISVSDWSREKIGMVILHELAHVQRRDVLWHWANRLSCCLAWFNPLIWIAARQGSFERERACDDWVINSGVPAVDYGQSLVEVAMVLNGRSLAGAISMAEPPLKKRLREILAPRMVMGKPDALFNASVAISFVVSLLMSTILRPLGIAEIEAASETVVEMQDELNSSDPRLQGAGSVPVSVMPADSAPGHGQFSDSIRGAITDEEGNPLADVEVQLELYHFTSQPKRKYVVIKRVIEKTDRKGQYSLDIEDLDLPEGTAVELSRAYHPSFVERTRLFWSVEELLETKVIPTVKLGSGRQITGQILDFDNQPIKALVRSVGTNGDPNKAWFPRAIRTDQEGNFALRVPLDHHVELLVFAEGHTAKRVFVPGNETGFQEHRFGSRVTLEELRSIQAAGEDLESETPDDNDDFDAGKIRLQRGTIVTGRVLDAVGKPLEGIAVGLETSYDSRIRNVAFNASYSSVTNPDGEFEFPPSVGKACVFVKDYISDSRNAVNRRVATKKPPAISPVRFNIDELKLPKGQSHNVELRAVSGEIRLTGTIRWDDDTPAAGVEVRARVKPNLTLGAAESDEHGNYTIDIPAMSKGAFLEVIGAKDKFGKWHIGGAYQNGQVTGQLVELTGKDQNIDWVLRELQSRPFDTPEYTKARNEFARLKRKAQVYLARFQQAEKEATTAEDRQRAYMDLDPRNAMAEHYLDFEERHRGERAAFLAIRAGMGSAVSVGDSETKASKGRNEMVSRLLLHYMDHRELASTFEDLGSGPPVPQREEILDAAIKRSPHREVRAQAMLYRCEFMLEDIRHAELLPLLKQWVNRNQGSFSANRQRELRAAIEKLSRLDVSATRRNAIRWLDVLDVEYADFRIQSEGKYYSKKIETITPGLRYALEETVVGKPVPQLDIKDTGGKPIDLLAMRGQPVVLTLCFDSGSQLAGQELANEFSSRDVQFLTVVGTDKPDEFWKKHPVESLVGTFAIERLFEGKVRSNWHVNSATTVLIDKQGILRGVGAFEEMSRIWLESQLK